MTVEEVLTRYVEALGGADRWQRLQAVTLRGTYTAFSSPTPFTLRYRRPNLYRFDHRLSSNPIVHGHDGETSWRLDPEYGLSWGIEMSRSAARVTFGEALFGGPLLEAAEKGVKIRYLGTGDLDGTAVHELEAALPNGAVERWSLDARSYLPLLRIAPVDERGEEVESHSYFSDYRSVDGIVLPHRVEKEFLAYYRVLEIEDVELDPQPEDRVFDLPIDSEMVVLAPLAGRWDVEVEYRTWPDSPWRSTRTEARIEARFHGALLQEELEFTVGNRRRSFLKTRAWDRFRNVYRETSFDNVSFTHRVFEGTVGEDGIQVDNLRTGQPWEIGGRVHLRSLHHLRDRPPTAFGSKAKSPSTAAPPGCPT